MENIDSNSTNTDLQPQITPEEAALISVIEDIETDQFHRDLRQHVEVMIPKMPSDVVWPLKKICSEDFWEPLDVGTRSVAGGYISFLVKAERLPLKFVKLVRNSRFYKHI